MLAPARTLIAILAITSADGAAARAEPLGEATANLHYQLRGELGVEMDSNARRTEEIAGTAGPAPVGSLLQRIVVSAALVDSIAPGNDLSVAATGAGKWFDADGAGQENVAIAQSSIAWRLTLGPRSRLLVGGGYYEAFQNPDAGTERRDFRSLAPTLQLGWMFGNGFDLTVGGGYRLFVFKADRDFDFGAPTAAADLRWAHATDSGADWELGAGGAFERRDFAGTVLVPCPPPAMGGLPCAGTEGRLDWFMLGHAEVTRTGRVLASVGYALHYNASNSYGETVTRHYAIVRFAASLPLALFVAARADLLFASYRDPLAIGQASTGNAYVSIEDENRSSIRLDLSRDFGERLSAFARYTFYANELGSDSLTYRRQTLLFSLAFSIDK